MYFGRPDNPGNTMSGNTMPRNANSGNTNFWQEKLRKYYCGKCNYKNLTRQTPEILLRKMEIQTFDKTNPGNTIAENGNTNFWHDKLRKYYYGKWKYKLLTRQTPEILLRKMEIQTFDKKNSGYTNTLLKKTNSWTGLGTLKISSRSANLISKRY